jgi:BirA family transcriptional regulator, biotin operon repressor / biotin---[acetyl-CoA-carboxylase] ligase
VEGEWLVALEQHAGKGRQGRSWTSAPGNFYGSTLVELGAADPSPQTLALIAGLALIEAVDEAIPAQPLMLKWPNDLLLLGKKVAGILLERTGDRVVVGFGVNLAVAPKLADRRCSALGGEIDPEAFAPLLATSFARLLRLWRESEPAMIVQAWLARAHPTGTRLTVHSSGEASVTGRFDGLERDGALRLRLDDGALATVRAGDVEL